MKVSVIVPVYNVKRYLNKCIDSILNQTMQELEVIIIDDGSTDGSSEVVDEYVYRDSRIRVVHNKNHGYGYSVNLGIKLATGEYIGIVESDDTIESDMYDRLYQAARTNNLDFIKSDRKEVFESFDGTQQVIRRRNINFEKLYNIVFKPLDHIEFYFSAPDTWSGIYSREFLLKNNIWHNETPGASFQDIGFAFQTYTLAERCMILDNAFYHYRIDNLESSIHNKEKVYTVCEEYDFVLNFLKENKKIQKDKAYQAYYVKRYVAYLNTIKRIDIIYSLEFLKKFRKDYLCDRKKSYFNEALFEEGQLSRINSILESPEQYLQRFMLNRYIYESIVAPYRKIIIYGTGQRAMELWKNWNLTDNRERFCFANSSEPEIRMIEDVPVYKIDDVIKYKDEALVIVAVGKKLKDELINKTKKLGFKNYISLEAFRNMAKVMREERMLYCNIIDKKKR